MVSVIITSKPVIYSQKHMLENLRPLYYTFFFFFFFYFSFNQNQLKEMFAFSSWSILKLIDQKLFYLMAMSNTLLAFGKLGLLNNLVFVSL